MKSFFLLFTFTILVLHGASAQCWKLVAPGNGHTIALKVDGTLWSWGQNLSGELGDGTLTPHISPVQVGTSNNWQFVAAGSLVSFAIKNDGTLWSWGSNQNACLGDSSTSGRLSPARVGTDSNWVFLSISSHFVLALKSDGSLWSWGFSMNGALGNTPGTTQYKPTKIGTATWRYIAAGEESSFAIRTNGTLWAWGFNNIYRLGDSTQINRSAPVQIGTDTNWRTVSNYDIVSVGVKTDGTLWNWGYTNFTAFGATIAPVPVRLGTDTNWATAEAGLRYAGALKTNGSLWTWGLNNFGQLGDGTTTDHVAPMQLGTSTAWRYISIGNGGGFMALQKDSSLWGWGSNTRGSIGDSTTITRLSPVKIGCGASITTGVFTHEAKAQFSVVPNPATDQIFIIGLNGANIEGLTLFDLAGHKVLTQGAAIAGISIRSLAPGMYYLQVMVSGQRYMRTVIKQ